MLALGSALGLSFTSPSGSPAAPPAAASLLLENGDDLLMESGDKLLLE